MAGCSSGDLEVDSDIAESSGYLSVRAQNWADYFGVADPPDVEVVRYVGTEELDKIVRQCVTDAGYPATDGGFDVPAGNEEAFALAQYTCYVQYPVPERYTQAWGDEQVRAQYRWTVDFVIPCLEERGHPIAPPPSEAVFLELHSNDPYFPFAEVKLSVPEDEFNAAWMRLETECPQEIPGSVLWDGLSVEEWKSATGR